MFDWFNNRISFKPSSSRWAVLAFGVAFSMFFVGSSGMLPLNPTEYPLLSLVFLWLGIAIFAGTMGLSIYWAITKPKDTGLDEMKKDIAEIKEVLSCTRKSTTIGYNAAEKQVNRNNPDDGSVNQ